MEAFVWDRSFSTGLTAMDDQHRGLIDIFNELHRTLFDVSLPADRRDVAMRRAFDRLMAYARAQFADEEALMQSCGLDERHQFVHRRQHEQFIRNLRELWADRDTLEDPAGRLMGFLSSWIGLHLLGVDQAMVHQMRLIEEQHSAQAAYEREANLSDKGLRAILNMVGRLYHDLSLQTRALSQARYDLFETERQLNVLGGRLEVHARFDELLQIPNRRYFDQRLREEVARAFRSEEALAVLVISLDLTVPDADAPDLPTTDACMQAVTGVVMSSMKRTTDLVARHGPHRLVVMMPETDRHGAARAAQRVVDAVGAMSMPARADGAELQATASVGVAGWVPRSRDDGELLVCEAESAQAFARHEGGNRIAMA